MKSFKIELMIILIVFVVFFASSASFSGGSKNPKETGYLQFSETDPDVIYKDYHPLEGKKETHKYFPDEVEKRVNDLLIDSYLGNEKELESHYEFFMQKDIELKKKNEALTGLSGNALVIINNQNREREEYISSQKEALKRLNEKDLKTLVKMRLKDENLLKAEKLLRDEKKNKAGRVFNSLLKSVDIISFSMGSILGSTIDTVVQTILNIRDLNNISTREKRAIVQFEEFLKKNPDSLHADRVRTKLAKLKAKKLKTDYKKEIRQAERSFKEAKLEEAKRSYQKALSYIPESSKAKRGLEQTELSIDKREKEIEKGLKVSRSSTFSSSQEKEDYQKLLYLVVKGDPEEIISKSREFIDKYKESPLKDEALYNLSIAYDLKGNHEKAKEVMKELAREEPDSNMGHHAKLLLNDENYNKYKGFQQARTDHRIDTIRYAVGGKKLAKDNISSGTSHVILEGVKSIETMGMANLLAAFFRTASMFGNDPVSNREIIDMGEKYLSKYPDSERSQEVRFELAKAYERERDYPKAMKHYDLSEKVSEKKIKSLREKTSKVLYQKAELTDGWEGKVYYYRAVMASYPDTKTARKAEEKLAELLKIKDQRYRLSKSFLMENRSLFGPNSLNIKPELLDGNIKNKEISDKGIAFLKDNKIKIYYQTRDGIKEKTYQINSRIINKFEGKLREYSYKRALSEKRNARSLQEEGIFASKRDLDETLNSVYLSKRELKKREKNIEFGADTDISPSGEGFNSQGFMRFSKYRSGLAFGIDERSPNLGIKFPVLSSPLEIESRIGESRLSIYPKIRLNEDIGEDYYLYKD
jgi:TolA-binding protein